MQSSPEDTSMKVAAVSLPDWGGALRKGPSPPSFRPDPVCVVLCRGA